MGISTDEHGTIAIDGAHIELFQLLRVKTALTIEVATGMHATSGRSVRKLAMAYCGSDKGTKHGVLHDYALWYHEHVAEMDETSQARIIEVLGTKPGRYVQTFRTGIKKINAKPDLKRKFPRGK